MNIDYKYGDKPGVYYPSVEAAVEDLAEVLAITGITGMSRSDIEEKLRKLARPDGSVIFTISDEAMKVLKERFWGL